MKIYHTETQADYDALMEELEIKGIETLGKNYWKNHRHETVVFVRATDEIGASHKNDTTCGSVQWSLYKYPKIPIIKYKAKAEDKMKFTKENAWQKVEEWLDEPQTTQKELRDRIYDLDDTPEQVVVPKFVAELFKRKKGNSLTFIFSEFAIAEDKEVRRWYLSQSGRFKSRVANAEDIIAKMYLYGYTIEPEKLYYIPLPHLETSDGLQQVLSKRENGKNYFASRPNENLKQRYTKEEISQVPEIYKFYATLIEEGEE